MVDFLNFVYSSEFKKDYDMRVQGILKILEQDFFIWPIDFINFGV